MRAVVMRHAGAALLRLYVEWLSPPSWTLDPHGQGTVPAAALRRTPGSGGGGTGMSNTHQAGGMRYARMPVAVARP
jgi:hypothetical protein